jgi:nitrogen-specific signal transduction histidine kinase
MGSEEKETPDDCETQLANLKAGIREVSHEVNNPLGIIRMALYFLHTTNPEGEKREHYFNVIEDGLVRIEQNLLKLKMLRENPSAKIDSLPSDH